MLGQHGKHFRKSITENTSVTLARNLKLPEISCPKHLGLFHGIVRSVWSNSQRTETFQHMWEPNDKSDSLTIDFTRDHLNCTIVPVNSMHFLEGITIAWEIHYGLVDIFE